MGLGKTVQAIALARLFRHEWPLLVIAPPSMKLAWADELEKWLPDMDASCVHMVAHGKDLGRISTASITIVSYGLLTQPAMQRAVLARKFQVVIADEAHMLKNRKAKRTRAVVPALKAAKRAILLTGTPALARPEELYVLLSALHPRRWGTFYRVCNTILRSALQTVVARLGHKRPFQLGRIARSTQSRHDTAAKVRRAHRTARKAPTETRP